MIIVEFIYKDGITKTERFREWKHYYDFKTTNKDYIKSIRFIQV
ncbi:MAG: hypothetical protein ACI4XM_01350 [Candidatus Coprovivens sp.]